MINFDIEKEYNLEVAAAAYANDTKFGEVNEKFLFKGILIEPLSFEHFNFFSAIINANIEEIDFDNTAQFKPAFMSDIIYGTPKLAHLLLYVNNLYHPLDFSREHFRGRKVKYLKPAIMREIATFINGDVQRYGATRIIKIDRRGING